jgi:endo-1,4-beta-xylanase
MIGACLAVTACREVTFWGFTDRYDWLDDIFPPGTSQAHIFDRNFEPKPAYLAVRGQLLARQNQSRDR